jgi:3-oxoadipate enol-lactonase
MNDLAEEKRGHIAIENGRINHQLAGAAGLDIVLLHGFSFDLRSWEPQLPHLSRQHRVLRYDLRGFGLSDLPRHPYSHADDLAQMIARLGLKRPLIVGLSLGANIAMSYALDHPEGLSGLVLASPGLPGHAWTTDRPPDAAREFARCNDLAATKSFWLGHPMFASLGDHPPAEKLAARMVDDYSGWHWYNSDMQSPSEPLSERFTISVRRPWCCRAIGTMPDIVKSPIG